MSERAGTSTLSLGERVARSAWRITPQIALSQVIGWGRDPHACRPPCARRSCDRFARQYGIDLDEAEKPIEAYSGLQEFFTRRLRAGARPIAAGADVVVSPADGTVVEVGTVHQGMLLDAKDAGFTLGDLLADGRRRRSRWMAGRTA